MRFIHRIAEWVADYAPVLSQLWGKPVLASDFSDDRLSTLAGYLARPVLQAQLDRRLARQTVTVYELQQEHLRLDATAIIGYHQITEKGLMQYGYANGKDSSQTSSSSWRPPRRLANILPVMCIRATGRMMISFAVTDPPVFLVCGLRAVISWRCENGSAGHARAGGRP